MTEKDLAMLAVIRRNEYTSGELLGGCYEFFVRRERRSFAHEGLSVLGPADTALFVQRLAEGLDREYFYSIHIDVQLNIIGYEIVAIGGLASVDVHPREVFRSAILSGAASIIVAHNHPSGSVLHSKEDIALAMRLKESGELLGIPVLDSLVVTEDAHSSLADTLMASAS